MRDANGIERDELGDRAGRERERAPGSGEAQGREQAPRAEQAPPPAEGQRRRVDATMQGSE
jgi:hypothetical protein